MKYSQTLLVGGMLALFATACVRHIYPTEKKLRQYDPEAYAASEDQRAAGSLWSEASPGLFSDARARRVGDIITVRIEERSDANRDANTQTGRQQTTQLGVTSFLTAIQRLVRNNPNLDPAQLVAASSTSDFTGGGTTSRSGEITAVLPVRIKHQLPNGDFYIEGTKVMLLNDEETHLYLSGVVRQLDIEPDNTVGSSKLADVELEYTGRGVVSERQTPGWLSRALDYLWPF